MKLRTFVNTLTKVKPALASKDLIPIMAHYCFQDGNVFAYNDVVAIMCPCDTDVEGAIRGDTLLTFVSTSMAKEVDIQVKNTEAVVKAGSAKLNVPMLGVDDFMWEPPSVDDFSVIVEVDEDLIRGLDLSLLSAGQSVGMPELSGITMSIGSHCTMFSSNGPTMARYDLDAGGYQDMRVILPTDFCKVWQTYNKYASDENQASLYLSEDQAMVLFDDGLMLFCKTLYAEEPVDFYGIFKENIEDDEYFCKTPRMFASAVKRASAFAGMDEKAVCTLTVKDEFLHIVTETQKHGVVRDRFKFEGHDDVFMTMDAPMLSAVLEKEPHVSLRVFDSSLAVCQGDKYLCLVSSKE